jgi:hypothetical protein
MKYIETAIQCNLYHPYLEEVYIYLYIPINKLPSVKGIPSSIFKKRYLAT